MENIIVDLLVLRDTMEHIKDLSMGEDTKTFNLIHLLQTSLNKTIQELDKLMEKEN